MVRQRSRVFKFSFLTFFGLVASARPELMNSQYQRSESKKQLQRKQIWRAEINEAHCGCYDKALQCRKEGSG